MRKNPLSNMSARGGIITSEFLEIIRGEKVANALVQPESFATFDAAAPKDKGELDRQIESSFKYLLERWDALSSHYLKMNVSEARSKWMIPLLRMLGFDLGFNKEEIVVEGEDKLRFRLSHRGWISSGAPMLHLVAPAQDLEEAGIGSEGEISRRGRSRSAHDELQAFLNVNKRSKWGIITNGVLLRVLREYYHTTTKGYVEFDIENIFREKSFTDFRAMYRMAHASRFMPDKEGVCPLDQFYKESVAAGVTVGENLRRNVKRAIEALGNGFLTPELAKRMVEDEESCKAYYAELLRVVYRLLFLLFAEQRAMLPTRDSLYAEEYSVTRLREMAEVRRGKDEHCDLWEGLKVTFRMLKSGCPQLRVFGYNGSLFDDSEIPILSGLSCKNEDVLTAVKHLTSVEEEHVLKRINYLDLGVEEIGSIYESLLDFVPRVFDTEQEIEEEKVAANTFFLDPRGGGRKTTGSYYTSPRLIDELIKSALKPVVEDRLAEAVDKEKALLSITVCDPACGSGAFLIAADNFLARELAELRTGQSEPPDREVKKATRDVLQQCIYGVDMNPMAVELAKVSLWINSCVEDMPLNFLDHHIKCGNSLIGAAPALLRKGVPDEAFTAVEGDDRAYAKVVRSRNAFEREQRLMVEFPSTDQAERAKEYAKLDEFAEKSPKDVEEKTKKYSTLVNSLDWKLQRFLADAWTAAFFWRLTADNPFPPTEASLRNIRKSGVSGIDLKMLQMIDGLTMQYRSFHWYVEFPDVFETERAGFDCVLGNPPWEKVKLQEREFFSFLAPEIAEVSTAAERSDMIASLAISTNSRDMRVYKSYLDQKRRNEKENAFMHNSGRFPLTGVGDVNTYALFAELATQMTGKAGRFGMVLKTGIASDDTTKDLFGSLVKERRLVSLIDIVNKKGIFPDVGAVERFSLLTCTSANQGPKEFRISVLNETFEEIADQSRSYLLSAEDIARMNPNTNTCPLFHTKEDAEMCRVIYKNNDVLVDENNLLSGNSWNLEYFRMFDMTNASGSFKKKEQLEDAGFELKKNATFTLNNDVFIPLNEGKLFYVYDHRHATFEGVPASRRFLIKAEAHEVNESQKEDVDYEVLPRYWIDKAKVKEIYETKGIADDAILLMRNASQPMTNARVSIGTLAPFCAASNGCPLIIMRAPNDRDRIERMLLFVAVFDSLTFDFVLRQKMSTGNINKFILYQVAAPDLSMFEQKMELDGKVYLAKEIVIESIVALQFNTGTMKAFFEKLGCDQPIKWNLQERIKAACVIDALIAHLYGLTRQEYEYILSRFGILTKQEIKAFGEPKTRNLCLCYFDKIRPKDNQTRIVKNENSRKSKT